jgi:hypothetical protein
MLNAVGLPPESACRDVDGRQLRLTLASVSAPSTLPPGFRILYIAHKVGSVRLSKGCCQHGLKLLLQSSSMQLRCPLGPVSKEALIIAFRGEAISRVPRPTHAGGERNARL